MAHVDRLRYLVAVIKRDPFELLRLLSIGMTTAHYRYIRRCIGTGSIVEPHTRIVNAANVRIGSNCLLKEGVYIRAGTEGRVEIKDRVAINAFGQIFGHGGVTIGEDTQIGPGALITTTEHDYSDSLKTRFKPVAIGSGVWIGAKVTILPGVTIGDSAVVGAGGVVTRDIPPRTVAVGVPARVTRG